MLKLGLFLLLSLLAEAQPRPVIIDTDAGSDDYLAIAFLLSHSSLRIEAITVANGLAHVEAGAQNLVRLLELSGRKGVPVFAGRPAPLRGDAAFPMEWRKISDELPGVELPVASRRHEARPAADYLVARLKDPRHPVKILALGPLTNLAEALARDAAIKNAIEELVIMGGALRVPGNLGDGGAFRTENKTAEWNLFVDPLAARAVFRAGIPIRLIPLDATNKVPVGVPFLREFQTQAHSPLARFVSQVLEADRKMIEDGYFYAWDPLAAVAFLHPAVVKTTALHIEIRQDSPEDGRTVGTPGRSNVQVAMDADPVAFRRYFIEAFQNE